MATDEELYIVKVLRERAIATKTFEDATDEQLLAFARFAILLGRVGKEEFEAELNRRSYDRQLTSK